MSVLVFYRTVVSRRGRIVDFVRGVDVGFETWVKFATNNSFMKRSLLGVNVITVL